VPDRHVEVVRIPASEPGLPTLVFLHEGLGSVALWKDFREYDRLLPARCGHAPHRDRRKLVEATIVSRLDQNGATANDFNEERLEEGEAAQ
jgi:hypothetical protein